MKKVIIFLVLLSILSAFVSCVYTVDTSVIGGADGPTQIIVAEKGEGQMYEQISGDRAKEIMDTESDYIILDVREQEEYDEGHIRGAVLIPYTEIETKAETALPNKDWLILVYCRSGRRSKIAAQALAKLGYTNVKEFGGIIDWKYEVVK